MMLMRAQPREDSMALRLIVDKLIGDAELPPETVQ
jgi:hypothetical protein